MNKSMIFWLAGGKVIRIQDSGLVKRRTCLTIIGDCPTNHREPYIISDGDFNIPATSSINKELVTPGESTYFSGFYFHAVGYRICLKLNSR